MEYEQLSDKNNLRWYRIPNDPRQSWERHDIGPSVHVGIGVGDLDGDGDVDILQKDFQHDQRVDIWLNEYSLLRQGTTKLKRHIQHWHLIEELVR